jgi:DNA-binding NarL/FixJ family response regulator
MSKTKLLIAEDHTIVREGIRALLSKQLNFEVIGEAEDGLAAVKLASSLKPDVVVMDISMPNLDGLAATRHLKKQCPEIKVLILTMHASEEYVYQILKNGADGYVVKDAAYEELIAAIEAVTRGKKYLSPSISGEVIDRYLREPQSSRGPLDKLTPKEKEVLRLIAEGHTNKEMAKKLFVSVKTVEFHRSNLMKKLDIHNQAALIRFAIRLGILNS